MFTISCHISKKVYQYNKFQYNTQEIFKNIKECNPNRKCNVLIVFDEIIADTISKKKRNPVLNELSITGGKLNISLTFIT